jgi:hypothetical protein
MMNKKLAAHEEERQIMDSPDEQEEARVVPQAITYGCEGEETTL